MTAPASRARPARRALDDLSLRIDRADIEDRLTALRLPEDRLDALARYETLPAESNRLYTTYIDLRAAALQEARIDWTPATERVQVPLPDGADGLLVFTEGDLTASALSPEAAAAGVEFTTIADYLERKPDRGAELLAAGTLPADDKFAQMTRALWTQGVVLDVPAGVRLQHPIIVRWAVGAPDRALLTRTVIVLGDGAEAAIVEELVPSGEDADGRQALLTGTMEVTLGAGAKLAVAGLQELGAGTSPSSTGCPGSGRARSCTGRSRSSVGVSCAAASTIGSRAIAARSNRSRSCSGRTSSCST